MGFEEQGLVEVPPLGVPLIVTLLDDALNLGHRHRVQPITQQGYDGPVHSSLPADDGWEETSDGRSQLHQDARARSMPTVLHVTVRLLSEPHAMLTLQSLSQESVVDPHATHLPGNVSITALRQMASWRSRALGIGTSDLRLHDSNGSPEKDRGGKEGGHGRQVLFHVRWNRWRVEVHLLLERVKSPCLGEDAIQPSALQPSEVGRVNGAIPRLRPAFLSN